MDTISGLDHLDFGWWPYLIAAIVGIITCIRSYMGGPECPSKERIDGKVVIVTGASSGIGFQTALELARRGGHIILACRGDGIGKEAVEKIRAKLPDAKVEYKELDLTLLKSVRAFAATLENEKIDILINNAGVAFKPFMKTEEGFEIHFVTNYLGHFLLTHLLLKKLQAAPQARIISLSSQAHYVSDIQLEDLNREKNYVAREAFGQSKLALLLMAKEMTKKFEGTKVTINSVHPGLVHGTKHLQNSPLHSSLLIQAAMLPWIWLLTKDSFHGAQTVVYAAVAPELSSTSGKYLSDCSIKEPSEKAQDEELAKALYEKSCQLVEIEI